MDVSEEKLKNREFMGFVSMGKITINYWVPRFARPHWSYMVVQWEFTNHGVLMGIENN